MAEPQEFRLEDAQRRIRDAVRVLLEGGQPLESRPDVSFSVVKPSGWHRHAVVCTGLGTDKVIERFWSWDRADALCERLNAIRKTLA